MTKRPVAPIILDGFGMRDEEFGNAVTAANKPNFDRYWGQYPHTLLNAKGEYVGLPEGQMGTQKWVTSTSVQVASSINRYPESTTQSRIARSSRVKR